MSIDRDAQVIELFEKEKRAAPASGEPLPITDSDMANAKRLAQQHGANVRFTPQQGWLVFDGKRWVVDEKSVRVQDLAKQTALTIFDEIKIAVDKLAMYRHAKKSQSKNSIEAMLFLARSEPGVLAHITDFDKDPWLFNLENGTLDLRTGKLRAHHREDLLSKLVPICYDEEADFELWDKFVHRITDDNDELYWYLRRLVGYLLVGDTSEQVLHFLLGLGANGKSVFCEVIRDLLGDYAATVSPELVMTKRHSGIPNDIAGLRGIRVALMNETTQGSRFDEAKLKDLTGGDSLSGRFLHQEFFDFKPTHRILIRGNYKPVIVGTDEGIWRRLRLVPFNVQIPSEEQDKRLAEKLRAELPGILRWAVQGCLEWQDAGLKPPAIVMDAVQQYREESDTLGRFIDECCNVKTVGEAKSSAFFDQYQTFVEKSGERWISSKDLPTEMQRRGFKHKPTKTGKIYLGVELQSVSPEWIQR
jgi:putative DNA primase/helicase